MGDRHKGKRWAAVGANVAASALAITASIAPKEDLPTVLQWMSSIWGWLACGVLFILGGVLVFLSSERVNSTTVGKTSFSQPDPPIYEEILEDSVGLIRHITITDIQVAKRYLEMQHKSGGERKKIGDRDG